MMNKDNYQGEEPVMCSKCTMVFESDADYKRHYDDNGFVEIIKLLE